MRDYRTWFWQSQTQNWDHRLSWLRPLFWCLALLLTAALASVPAAAQCDAYVVDNATNSIRVINTLTKMVVAVIPVQWSPFGVAITPNGAFAYVTNTGMICDFCPVSQPPSVSVIDTASYKVVATIPVGQYPAGVAITPNGAFAYVANFNSNNVSVINTATNSVTATVTVITTATTVVVATVGVGGKPESVAITPDGFFAYTSNFMMGTLSVIDTATNGVVDTVQAAGTQPLGIAIKLRPDAIRPSCR